MTLGDRLASACLSGIFGVVYAGLMILASAPLGFSLDFFHTFVIAATAFALIGFFMGPFVGDVLGGLLFFFWGLFEGLDGSGSSGRSVSADRFLRGIFLIGLVTGLVLWLAT